jgi:hypothetical protein
VGQNKVPQVSQLQLPKPEAISYERYLHELAQLEAYERYNRKIALLLKRSGLPRDKILETFEQDRLPKKVRSLLPTLCEGSFLARAENILAFGNPDPAT